MDKIDDKLVKDHQKKKVDCASSNEEKVAKKNEEIEVKKGHDRCPTTLETTFKFLTKQIKQKRADERNKTETDSLLDVYKGLLSVTLDIFIYRV